MSVATPQSRGPFSSLPHAAVPDVPICRLSVDQYHQMVADTSLERDRKTKKRIYARAQVRIYWIINLVDRRVEVYTDPMGPTDEPDYRHRRDYGSDEEVPIVLGGKQVGRIPVRELLP